MSDGRSRDGGAGGAGGETGAPREGRPRVLLVDDLAPNLAALEGLLERLAAESDGVRSGEEALARLEGAEYAVVLLDVHMPGLDGFQTLERLRRRDRVTPVLFVTAGDADPRRVRRAYELGAVDFLAKPLDPHALRAKVGAFLELARARDEARARAKIEAERERLALSEARYRSFVEATSQMVWATNADGEVEEDSPSWRAFTGQSYEAWRGRGWLGALHPDDVGRAAEAWSRAVRAVQPYDVEYRVRRHDGVYRVARARAAPVRDASGRVREWVGVNVDVTEQKRAEAERDALLAREQRARAVAEGANRMKDEFLATVSHELRTPLNAILGWATMLEGGDLDAPTRARAVETIARNARAQARLIEDLLDLSRALGGKFALALGPVELARPVEAALDAVRPAAEAKGIRLWPSLDASAALAGDAERLQQVAWNLLSNAIKFTPRGGGVWVALRRAPSYVELEVADSGQGIEPDFLPHVFEPFRQQDGGITRRAGGLGLGLSIVRSLVELHGGTVSVRSDGPGRGATFAVRLPTAPPCADRADPEPGPASERPPRAAFECPPALAGLRVLVVDDEPDARALVAFVLGRCRARVSAVGGAAEAFAELGLCPFDVLVSDVGMPGEDGLSLIGRVRRLPPEAGGRIPAVALTAYARAEDRTLALRAGFDAHLVKPIDPGELVLAIAALVAKVRG
ncbi:MAG TPA: response regulator [Polyangiaceae bacterium]|nr:response regulator [Polyangiaceae bacterium]